MKARVVLTREALRAEVAAALARQIRENPNSSVARNWRNEDLVRG